MIIQTDLAIYGKWVHRFREAMFATWAEVTESGGVGAATWISHANADEMAHAVTTRIAGVAREAVAHRGRALLVLPGGKSPARIFERLQQHQIDWSNVTLVPSDERVVPSEHRFSNAAFFRKSFGKTAARFVPLVSTADVPCRKAGDLADAALRALEWPPDLVWLDVDGDGHVASIFEGPDFDKAVDSSSARRAVGLRPDPLPTEAPVARVTLTCRAIRSARHLLITLSGLPKRNVVESALACGAKPVNAIDHVLTQHRLPIEIHWTPV